MSTHIAHPRIIGHGLCDDCPRCAEIAADPFMHLDSPNLLALEERTTRWMRDEEGSFPRSRAEHQAMREMEKTLVRRRQLEYARRT